ncbi:MAG: VOC family protein [Pseudomonadota bacterium]
MAIEKLLAQVTCTDLSVSADWYGRLFERPADLAPMTGLLEWHHGTAGLQLLENLDSAGRGGLTVIVSGLAAERVRISKAGLVPGEIVTGDFATFFQVKDPDGNAIIFAEPNPHLT